MKILAIAKTFERGGAATGARNTVSALRAAGLEVVEVDANARAKSIPTGFFRVAERMCEKATFGDECHCLKFGPANVDLEDEIMRHAPDIVQLCDISGNTLGFRQLSRVAPPIVHRVSDFWPYLGAYHYRNSREAPDWRTRLADAFMSTFIGPDRFTPDLVVAPSQWIATKIETFGKYAPPTEVIRNSTVLPDTPAPRSLPSGNALRLGFVSAKVLDPRKGFDLLLPHLHALTERGWELSLQVFGSLPTRRAPAIGNIPIVYHGAFAPDALDSVYNKMDILLCPSRVDNSPNVVCEAMARGTPVIAQSDTGASSYVTPGETGYLFDFQSQAAMCDGLDALISRIVKNYRTMSQHSIRMAQHELSPLAIGERYIRAYERLLNAPTARERLCTVP